MGSPQIYCSYCGAVNGATQDVCFACSHALAEEESAFLIHKRYRIVRPVGTGGFGAVYKVEDTRRSNAIVALKQINLAGLSALQIIEATETFNREIRLLSPLQHPNLPHIHEHFTDPEHWYMVMDFIEGETLEEYLEAQAKQSKQPGMPLVALDEIVEIGLQLCTVLEYLHTRQPPIIFRDLKPGNIMRMASGKLFLIDFGIARQFKPGQAKDTLPFGSPGYAAPEQYGKSQTTPRADIYSLGALLHHLLTGDDPSENAFQFAPLRMYGGGCLSQLEAFIQRMVQMQVERRPQHIGEVRSVLQHLQSMSLRERTQTGYIVPTVGGGTGSFAAGGSAGQVQQQAMSAPKVSRRKITLGLGVGTAAVLGGAGFIKYLASQPGQMQQPAVIKVQETPMPTAGLSAVAWSPLKTDAVEMVAFARTDKTIEITGFGKGNTDNTYDQKGEHFAWSPDGTQIASDTDGQGIQIWKVDNGSVVNTFTIFDKSSSEIINTLAWSPDGKSIIASSFNSIKMLDVKSGIISVIGMQQDASQTLRAQVLAWSPDSTRIGIAVLGSLQTNANLVEVWDIGTNQLITTYNQPLGIVAVLAWSPDGTRIVFSDVVLDHGNTVVHIWDIASGTVILSLESKFVLCLAWSPDGTKIALGGTSGIDVRDISKGGETIPFKDVVTRKAISLPIKAIKWTQAPDEVLTANSNKEVQIWGPIS